MTGSLIEYLTSRIGEDIDVQYASPLPQQDPQGRLGFARVSVNGTLTEVLTDGVVVRTRNGTTAVPFEKGSHQHFFFPSPIETA